jgi:TRAP-type C4-dicarboxylate transport system permease small subunit
MGEKDGGQRICQRPGDSRYYRLLEPIGACQSNAHDILGREGRLVMLTMGVKKITRVLIAIGATVLALMMFLTALDVGLRYALNRPLAGAFELVEYMMAILIPFCIAYCADQKGHVAVELILDRFPKKIQNIADIITTLITLIFVLVIAWQNILYFFEVKASNLTSAVLLIPTYPFVAPIAIGIGAFALILAVHLLAFLSGVKKQ